MEKLHFPSHVGKNPVLPHCLSPVCLFYLFRGYLTSGTLVTKCVEVFTHTNKQFLYTQQGIQELNSVLTPLPEDSIRSHSLRARSHKYLPPFLLPPSDASHKTRLSITCVSDQLAIDCKFQPPLPWV